MKINKDATIGISLSLLALAILFLLGIYILKP